MKKIMLLVVFSVMAAGASAQWSWGVKGGWNISKLTNMGGDMRPGYYFGAFAEYHFMYDLIGIQSELLYSRQGSDIGDRDWIKSNYLTVPVLLKIHATKRLAIEAGPRFGFALRYKGQLTEDGAGAVTRFPSSEFRTFDLGVVGGISFMMLPQLEFTARYDVGLTKTLKNARTSKPVRNGVLQIGAAARFGFDNIRGVKPDSLQE